MSKETNGKSETVAKEIPVKQCVPSKMNPRVVNELSPKFIELSESIEASGVRVHITVRPHPKQPDKYEILSGERRWRASRKSKRETIPAIARNDLTEQEAMDIVFFENFAREDLTPLEEGKAVQILLEKYAGDVKAVASALKWTERTVRLCANLKNLSPGWRKKIQEDGDGLTAAHLALIARLPRETQDEFLDDQQLFWTWGDNLRSLKEVEKNISGHLRVIASAGWKEDDAIIVPTVGSCAKCKRRSDAPATASLFVLDEEPKAKKGARCLDPKCWMTKQLAHLKKRKADLQKKHPKLILLEDNDMDYSDRESLREAFGQTVSHYDVEAAKKDSKGAVPALVVGGKGAGKLCYVRVNSGYGNASKSNQREKGTPTPLKERRAMLSSKRWAQVLIDLEGKILDTPVDRLSEIVVLSLAAIFGTSRRLDYQEDSGWTRFTALSANKDVRADVVDRIWCLVCPVLTGRLHFSGGVTQVPKSVISEAKCVAKLLDVDLDAMFAEVSGRKGLTEPKSWVGLNADGTPKGMKKISAKKKSA